MEEYLAFVDFIGIDLNGSYIYRFDFTYDPDSVWGDFFNIAPSALIPDLQPDTNSLSRTAKVKFSSEMQLAKKNSCFSMQDCIDGIIPLMFSEIGEDTIEVYGHPLFFRFGEKYATIEKTLLDLGIEMYDIENVEKGDESPIDNLIDNIDFINNDDLDDLDF
jgi:hypothetical protein